MESGITLTLTNTTDTTVTITATAGGFYTIDTYSIEVFDTNSSAGTPVATQAFTIAADQSVPVVVSGLSAGTTYYAFLHGASQGYDSTSVEFTTLDNTPKVATVSQWQDLVNRIKTTNIGLARELTADDYDYPTGSSPTSVAAWLLAPGLYTAAESVWIRICAGATMTVSAKKNFIVLNGPGTSNKTIVDLSNRDGLNMGITMYYTSTSGSCVGTYMSFLTRNDVVDNLNSISDTNPLSANQGRLLNNKIEPLQALANYYTAIEAKTGATWIDGSTIYKKTITYSITTTGDNTAPHGITNLGHVVKLEGVLVSSSGDSKDLNYNDMNNAAVTYVHSTSVRTYAVGSDVVGRTAYVTIYYTKSS